jgi:hypothetical protein
VFEGRAEQLDVWSSRVEHTESKVGSPLKEDSKVVVVGIESPAAVTGQERRGGSLSLI